MKEKKTVTFWHRLFPILFMLILVVYGMGIRSTVFGKSQIDLQLLIIICIVVTVAELLLLGFRWSEIEKSIVAVISKMMPAFIIMIAIGVLIGTWMISGTIPMMIYYGMQMVNVRFLYVTAFLISCVFSLVTGSSWGSIATIGVVLMSIAAASHANLAVVAAAAISGANFGDKMSPLSDTTNLAAMLAEIPVYSHVRSMMNSTIPAAAIATMVYLVYGLAAPVSDVGVDMANAEQMLAALKEMFHFNPLLLLPLLIVLVGSIKKLSSTIVMVASALVSAILALIFQNFSFDDVANSIISGFSTSMATWMDTSSEGVAALSALNRGGLTQFQSVMLLAALIFAFIGCLDVIDATPAVVGKILGFAKTRFSLVVSTLVTGLVFNALLCHGYASMMLTANTFKGKYDELNVPRRVLSRSLEDSVTFTSTVIPWHMTAVFMSGIVGVTVAEYMPWMVMNYANIILAVILAYTGIGCFKNRKAGPELEEQ